MDYSKANYNALELSVSDAPQTELSIGGTAINCRCTEEQTEAFTAELTTWQTTAAETQTAPNALVLTAASEAQTNVWHFGGEAYKLLYNSGVEYLVFASGDYIAVIPTAGFTGGTQYGKLKAGGVSTRKFEYTLIQDEALRETTLSVQVEGETYLLEENMESPMYRYDVLVGTKDMMQNPYESYKPSKGSRINEKTASLGALLLALALPLAAQAETVFAGEVTAETAQVIAAPYGGLVEDVRVRVGDSVKIGDPIATVETAKTYASTDGTVSGVFAHERCCR